MREGLLGLVAATMVGCAATPPVTTLAPGQAGAIRFSTLTIEGTDFLSGNAAGRPATISGSLTLPAGPDRVPAVVLLHGCSGQTRVDGGWAAELPAMGVASFRVDSFNEQTNAPLSLTDPCITRGATVGPNPSARERAGQEARAFLGEALKLRR